MIKRTKGKNAKTTKVTFVIPHNPDLGTVSVVGDFNDWNPSALKLAKRNNGTRSAAVELPKDASYRFRYYASDGAWFNDDAADAYVVGDHGAEDCVINL